MYHYLRISVLDEGISGALELALAGESGILLACVICCQDDAVDFFYIVEAPLELV